MDETKRRFRGNIAESIDNVFDKIPEGAVYSELREAFEMEIAMAAVRRTGNIKKAARKIGVNYRTIRRMLGK